MKRRTNDAPTKCVLYTRVSTGKQAASGLGLDAQLAACRDHAKRKGYSVIGEFTDAAISGKDGIKKRPGLQAVLSASAQKPDVVVIVYSLSRLSRRQSLTWALLDDRGDYQLQIESATEPFDTSSPMGKAMMGMLAVWAQLESDMCSERTTDALAEKHARGHKLGAKPLAEKHPDAALKARELYASGRYTHRTLADQLNALGLPTALGGKWHATTVRRVLAQPLPDDDGQ